MTDWGRIQRIELELAQAYGRVMRLTEERDTARTIAVRLEGENAQLLEALDAVVLVPVIGDAS